MKSFLPLLKNTNSSAIRKSAGHFHITVAAKSHTSSSHYFIQHCFPVLYHYQLSITNQQQNRFFHSQLAALYDKSGSATEKRPSSSAQQQSGAASNNVDPVHKEGNTPLANQNKQQNAESQQDNKDGDDDSGLLKQKYEQVQERVEEALPQHMHHLKQQEGESDKQHRKRLAHTVTEKIKEFIKKYGFLGVLIYFAIYFANIALFFLMIEYGLFKQGDVVQKLKDWGLGKHFDVEKTLNGKKSSLALAWILTKFTEPLRMMITVSIVPSIYRGLVSARVIREVVTKAPKP
mmetsp:Transcript_8916/g.32904  ORF Transcript_8916/g.32904 Transcript_8916/m.32904 type:complete len:290 (-) Transcript_8916:2101-2970(-)